MHDKKITRQRDGRMESYIIGTKITRPRDGWHKNVSPEDGELNGLQENNSPRRWTDRELNGWHKNNLPKRWMKGDLINSPNRDLLHVKLKLAKTHLQK